MLRFGLLIMLILSLANAVVVGPQVYEQDDHGDISLNEFVYALSVDCDAATLRVRVMNESMEPVVSANTYLKYVDFASPLISTGATDESGKILHQLPGNVSLMRGLFILVIEKNGYRNKEIHFDILRCLPNQSGIPSPPQPSQQPPPPPENTVNDSPPPVVQNATDTNTTVTANETDTTEAAEIGMPYSDLYILAFLILLLILFKRKHP